MHGGGGDLVEEALVVDVLVEVLPPLLREHTDAPLLHHRQRALAAAEVDHARVEVTHVVGPAAERVLRRVELIGGHEDVGERDQLRLRWAMMVDGRRLVADRWWVTGGG